jgi:hypothetical protein
VRAGASGCSLGLVGVTRRNSRGHDWGLHAAFQGGSFVIRCYVVFFTTDHDRGALKGALADGCIQQVPPEVPRGWRWELANQALITCGGLVTAS